MLTKRPVILSVICITGYISALVTFPQVFSPPVKKLGAFIPAIFGILVSLHFISCVGIWYLKKWGVELYLASFFAKTLFSLVSNRTGPVFYVNIIISSIFILLLLKYYRRLNGNL